MIKKLDGRGAGVRFVHYKLSKSRTKFKGPCILSKKTTHMTRTIVTQPINMHDAHTVLLVPKLGPVMTNHVREFYSIDY